MFIYMSVYPSPDEWKRSFGLSIVPHISFRTALFLILTLTCGARSSMRAKIPPCVPFVSVRSYYLLF